MSSVSRFLPRAGMAAVAAALMLGGCMSATTYKPATGKGFTREGYSEQQVEANRFRVAFAGNSYTSRETVEKYLLYRAAELTVQQGFDYFVTADRDTDKQTRTYTTGGFAGRYGSGFGYWGPSWRYYGRGFGWRGWDPWFGDPFWADNFDVTTVEKYEAVAEIVMGKGAKPSGNPRAFDAHDVMAKLGPTIILPK